MIIAKAQSMRPFFVNMEIKWDLGPAESRCKLQAVLNLHARIFPGMPDKTGRCIRSHLQFIGKQTDQFGRRIWTQQIVFGALMDVWSHGGNYRIAKNPKVRP